MISLPPLISIPSLPHEGQLEKLLNDVRPARRLFNASALIVGIHSLSFAYHLRVIVRR